MGKLKSMTGEKIRMMKKEDVKNYIGERLVVEGERLHFEMSGYESRTGENTVYNQRILNRFAYLGIYDYGEHLFLDFYKGTPTIFLDSKSYDLGGYGTRDIVYKVFELTILRGKSQRRRS